MSPFLQPTEEDKVRKEKVMGSLQGWCSVLLRYSVSYFISLFPSHPSFLAQFPFSCRHLRLISKATTTILKNGETDWYMRSPQLLAKRLGKLYCSIARCTGRILHGHLAIITKPSPHYVLNESTSFLHGCEIKSGSGLGTRLQRNY